MKIFISGMPRMGKTTIIKKLISEFGLDNFFGFWVEEIKENKKRSGFRIVSTWGENEILAHEELRTPYRVGKYFVRKDVLDRFSERFLKDFRKDKILVLDEIGPMEFYSDKFKELVEKILKENCNVISVVHRKFLHLVPSYIWLDDWWDVYNKVRRAVSSVLRKTNIT